MFRLDGKTALITGASRGLGHALARELSARGWRLVVDGRDAERLAAAVATFSTPELVTALPGDVADPEHRAALAEAVGPRLDLLVNNASDLGPSPLPPLARLRVEDLQGVLAVTPGYAGGTRATADYETVCTGRTKHAEAIRITYDPSKLTYGQLLKVFFSVAHDPTLYLAPAVGVTEQPRSAHVEPLFVLYWIL